MPLNFTLKYKDRINDTEDFSGDVNTIPGIGTLAFTPTFAPGSRFTFGFDTGVGTRSFFGYLDADGVLRPERGSITEGIRLWANDPEFGVDRFQYHVTAPDGLTDQRGRSISFCPLYFDAPDTDTTFYLAAAFPPPGQFFGRGPGAFNLIGGAYDEDGNLVLENADGSFLSPIVPRAGTLLLIENGDGTVTIG